MSIINGILSQNESEQGELVQDSLRLNYDFSDTNCYSGSGTVITDLAGNHNAVTVGNPAFLNEAGADCLEMLSTTHIQPSGSFSATNWTVGYWFKYKNNNTYYQRVWGMNGYRLELVFQSNKVYIYDGGWRNTGIWLDPYTEWHNIVFRYTNSPRNFKLYKNNIEVYSGTIGRTMTGTFRICGSNDNRRPYVYLGAVTAYNKALTVEEITQNYDFKKAYFGR